MGILPWDLVRLDRPSADSRSRQSESVREPQTFVAALSAGQEALHSVTPPE